MKGYFAVGVEGVSKPMNLGNLVRIAHAFDASFFFSVAPRLNLAKANSDTSNAEGVLPFYSYDHPSDFRLPLGCRLVGVEITDDAVELPRFRHPNRAAYVFGAERYSLSPQMLSLCEFVVKIPTRFSIVCDDTLPALDMLFIKAAPCDESGPSSRRGKHPCHDKA